MTDNEILDLLEPLRKTQENIISALVAMRAEMDVTIMVLQDDSSDPEEFTKRFFRYQRERYQERLERIEDLNAALAARLDQRRDLP